MKHLYLFCRGKPVAETSVPNLKVKDAPGSARDPYAFDASDEDMLQIDERPKKIRKSEKKIKPFGDDDDMAPDFTKVYGEEEVVLAPVQPVSTLDLGGEVDVVAFMDHKSSQQKSSKESKHSK